MASQAALLQCPMCSFTVPQSDDYFLHLHFEQIHTTDSPFRIEHDAEAQLLSCSPAPSQGHDHGEDTPPSDEGEATVMCPEPECTEIVPLTDYNEHLDYHTAETLSFDDKTKTYQFHRLPAATMHSPSVANHTIDDDNRGLLLPHVFDRDDPDHAKAAEGRRRKIKKHSHRKRSNTNSSEKSTLTRSMVSFNPFSKPNKTAKPPSKSARLGKAELGPYAWEERMPKWLYDQLAAGPAVTVLNRIGRDGRLIKQEQVQNETAGIIPVLAQLSALDSMVKEAYYCHPSTLHIGKTPREGGFCGYRNIQMLVSYIQGAKAQGHEQSSGRTPGILKLQDLIEEAWDKGINHIGRIQTGGICGTRKYIGTPEAQAYFLSSEIDCAVEMFSDAKDRKVEAHETLLDAVQRYFAQAAAGNDGSNVRKTLIPPIYLQQPGHSITIIGFERRRDGACNLMVFDPMYSTSPAMHKLLGRKSIRSARPEILHAYRRGVHQLKKHAAFEILMLTATPPLFPAWDILRQFPDARFVYAFFRACTLGYDVYPESAFLQNFPWQQYGGLWICDDARFARSDPMSDRDAQALRSITGGVALSRTSDKEGPSSWFKGSVFDQLHAAEAHVRHTIEEKMPSSAIPLSGPLNQSALSSHCNGNQPNKQWALLHPTQPYREAMIKSMEPSKVITQKYLGTCNPLGPILSTEAMWEPTMHGTIDETNIQHVQSLPIEYASSPNIDCAETNRAFMRWVSRNREHYLCSVGHNGNADARRGIVTDDLQTQCTQSRPSLGSSSNYMSSGGLLHIVSPRTAMARNIMARQAFQTPHGGPQAASPQTTQRLGPHSQAIVPMGMSTSTSLSVSPGAVPTLFPCIGIANGTEVSAKSPISSTGTVLAYKSRRAAASGLLGVRPLSETQVAEYRFWRPCHRRSCAFGCGDAHHGEWTAAKRLFVEIQDVEPQPVHTSEDVDEYIWNKSHRELRDSLIEQGYEGSKVKPYTSNWAGSRLVMDWGQLLSDCERDSVARI